MGAAVDYCLRTLDAMANSEVDGNLSVKMTQLGLDIDYQFFLEDMKKIVSRAKKYGNLREHRHGRLCTDLDYP